MHILDISVGIDENLPIWPGDPTPEVSWISEISAGEPANISAIKIGAHTGTCLLYTSPSPRDRTRSRMPSSA